MNPPRFATLHQWLDWQETLHPKAVELGLERIKTVAERLALLTPAYRVITVAGTNGKGSSVAFLEAILLAAGYRVGAYTSPHLLRYNERIRINGKEVEDTTLCDAFARIDAARGGISLTYFEFATLAALESFRQTDVEVAVLEVGLGGRLDAVNIVDADAALITSVGMDHMEWLGPDRESIGFEKAAVYRRDRPAICADPDPPHSVLRIADNCGAPMFRIGQDYNFERYATSWHWWNGSIHLNDLPLPVLQGDHQLANAAAAIMTLQTLRDHLPIPKAAIHQGLSQAYIAGRFEVITGPVEWIFDVTHNGHGAAILARCLETRSCSGRTHAVLGMLKDKDATAFASALNTVVDVWYTATLSGFRGRSGESLGHEVGTVCRNQPVIVCASVQEACMTALQDGQPGDRVLVSGSFHTVAEALTSGLQPKNPGTFRLPINRGELING